MVSLRPLPLGSETQGLIPSPITKMLEMLRRVSKSQIHGETKYSPSSESPVQRIFNVHDIETTNVLLAVCDDTSTTHVTTTSDHDDIASIKLHKISNLVLVDIKLDGVVDMDEGVWITDCSAVVGDNMRDTTSTESDFADLEELVGGLLGSDAVDGKSTLNVIEETEVLARLLNTDDICSSPKNKSAPLRIPM